MAELFFLWYKKQDTRHKTLKVEQVFIIVQTEPQDLSLEPCALYNCFSDLHQTL